MEESTGIIGPILHIRNQELRKEFSPDNRANKQTEDLILNSFI